jgi:hypothetical protein
MLVLGAAKRVLGVQRIVKLLPQRPARDSASERRRAATTLAREVDRVAAVMPGSPRCLTRSLTLLAALRWRGIPAVLHVGVARSRTFGAHAWVEADGVALGQDGAGEGAHASLWTAH